MSILRQIKALHPKPEIKLQIINVLRSTGEQGINDLAEKLGYRNTSSLYRYLDDLTRGGVVERTRSDKGGKWAYRIEDFYINLTPETVAEHFSGEIRESGEDPELEMLKNILYEDNSVNVVDASGEEIPFSPAVLMKDFLDAGVCAEESLNITLHMKKTAYNGIESKEMRGKIHGLLRDKGYQVAADRYRRYIIDPIKVEDSTKVVEWEERDLKDELKQIREENKILTVSNREMNRLTVNTMKNLKKLDIEPIPKKFIQEYLKLLLRNTRI